MKMRPHHALQRLLVRMQYDPGFAARVLDGIGAGVTPELAELGLGERERRFLAAVDPRAFRHDPLRRRRALHGLLGELKASSAIALAETRRIAFLDGFFESPGFHRAVTERGSLAAAFAAFLLGAGLATPQLPDVVRIEAQLARSRRALAVAGGPDWRPPPLPPGGLTHVARAPGIAVGRFSPDALAAIQAAERYLFEVGLVPAVALADDAPRLVLPPPSGAPAIALGFVPTQSGISLVELEPALFAALVAVDGAGTPVERLGVELAASLVEDEVLIAVGPPGVRPAASR